MSARLTRRLRPLKGMPMAGLIVVLTADMCRGISIFQSREGNPVGRVVGCPLGDHSAD
jgi:hypothetical protein